MRDVGFDFAVVDGKQFEIILARRFEPEEGFFYEKQQTNLLK